VTLDCTNLKPGDKVRLRNGDIDVVQRNDHDSVPIKLGGEIACHFPDGRWHKGEVNDLDIVEILTNPEPEMQISHPRASCARLFPVVTHPDGSATIDDRNLSNPAKITINGKQYVPAKDPSLCYPISPITPAYVGIGFTLAPITNEVIAITHNGKRFTPANSWPEPITDRDPTEEDGDKKGEVQILNSSGDWKRYAWNGAGQHFHPRFNLGWARTSDWKPRPVDKKTFLLQDLKQAREAGIPVSHGALDAAIELLEATP
jgi:hypothetical protein